MTHTIVGLKALWDNVIIGRKNGKISNSGAIDMDNYIYELRKKLQNNLRHMIREAENGELADLTASVYRLAKDCGLNVTEDECGEYQLEEKE